MPYIRLYSQEVPLEEKRSIAQQLISITLSTFQLRPEERSQITIQFMPRQLSPWRDASRTSGESAVMLEFSDQHLTAEKISAFVKAATPMLGQSAAVKPRSRIARMLGKKADPARQIAFQFREVRSQGKAASSDRFGPVPMRKAA